MNIELIANAGIFVESDRTTFLIDGLHTGSRRFSPVSQAKVEEIVKGWGPFRQVDWMIFTHDHSDHWNEDYAVQFVSSHPDTRIVVPAGLEGALLRAGAEDVTVLDAPEAEITDDDNDITLRFQKFAHEGEEYKDVANYACFVKTRWESFFVLGDAAAASITRDNIEKLTGGEKVDAAFVNFPLLTLAAGRHALDAIDAEAVIAFHLPFKADDRQGYRTAAQMWKQRVAREQGVDRIHILEDAGQIIELSPR